MIFRQLNGFLSTHSTRAALAMTGLVGVLSMTTMGCDTVALISFQEREFNSLETSGLTPIGGQCDGSEGDAMLRFVMVADDNRPIRPGDTVGQEVIQVSDDSITIANTQVFEYPDVECETNDDCRFAGDGFTCGKGLESLSDSQKRCLKSASLSLDGAVQFDSDITKNQLFGVVFENSGSLDGWLPANVGDLYPDWDGDGTADGSQDVTLNPARATDRANRRSVALTGVRDSWEDAARLANDENRRTLFGLWQFSGTSTANVRSLIAEVSPSEAVWSGDPNTIASAANSFDDPANTRGNVYQAMRTVLEDGFGQADYAGYEKTLLVFVDGPDDLRLNAFDAQSVIDEAVAQDVRVFIVQLDPQIATEANGTPLVRDDWQYWQNQSDPCASDDECRNYEECRVPTSYARSDGGTVEITTSDTFCMPKRDENGRFGPIHDYSEIACSTDGGYLYVKSASALRRRMQWLPFTMDGLWKVQTVLDVVENGQVSGDEPYAVQGDLTVSVGERSRSFQFSQVGDPLAGREDDDQDTRTVLFVK